MHIHISFRCMHILFKVMYLYEHMYTPHTHTHVQTHIHLAFLFSPRTSSLNSRLMNPTAYSNSPYGGLIESCLNVAPAMLTTALLLKRIKPHRKLLYFLKWHHRHLHSCSGQASWDLSFLLFGFPHDFHPTHQSAPHRLCVPPECPERSHLSPSAWLQPWSEQVPAGPPAPMLSSHQPHSTQQGKGLTPCPSPG